MIDINQNKVLKWALILGIIVVLNLFFAYTMKVVYNEPKWDDDNFCGKEQVIEKVATKEQCLEKGGQWNENIVKDRYYEGEPIPVNLENAGYCNLNFICNENFQTAREDYEKKVFMSLIVLGVISVVLGFVFATQQVLSVAFSLGGVLTFIWASMRYWQFASEFLQVGILGLALVVLIYLGVKKFK